MGTEVMSVQADNTLSIERASSVPDYADLYRPIANAFGASAGVIGNAGSLAVIASDASASPWWASRLVEIPEGDDAYAGVGFLVSCQHEPATHVSKPGSILPFLASAGASQVREAVALSDCAWRHFSLDFGRGVVAAMRGAVTAFPLAAPVYAPAGLVNDQALARVPDSQAVVQYVAAAEPVLDDAVWDDSDEEPRWLAMDDIPYRGGGVMARQRHRQ